MSCHVFVDFDGTIVPGDATDGLLQAFAEPEWLAIEEEWKAGRIGSRECMGRQIDLLRVTPRAFDAFVADVKLDPDFPAFVELCRSYGAVVTVVSDGLDRTVKAVLDRAGLDLPFYANRLEWTGGDRWRLGFPYARAECTTLSGNCKCQFAEAASGCARVMVGDGRSDFCISGRVDMVLAKGALAAHCKRLGLPHHPIRGFSDAVPIMARWLAADAAADRAQAGSRGTKEPRSIAP